MFADRAKIYVRSGKGGDGHVSFRREKYVPSGGPDGGDGGHGGDVIFVVDEGLNTLIDFRHIRKYKAGDGEEGGKKNCRGKDGEDIIIKVPAGTVIKEAQSGQVITDMSGDNKRVVLLKGGKGGNGNQHYATSTMQAPKYAQPGQAAQELELLLELKVIADVGLVGFPNVGKSTFLSRVTNARPKIANYHFTTLNPNLGVVDLEGTGGFVIADIPGLIEGASEGIGLGHEFLRHIERTKVIIHIVDAAGTEGRDPIQDIYAINKELEAYNPEIAARPQVIAANKIDAIYTEDGSDPVAAIRAEFEPGYWDYQPESPVKWSAREGKGLAELTTEKLTVRIDKKTGALTFLDKTGKCLLAEKAALPRQMEYSSVAEGWLYFDWPKKEKLYAKGVLDSKLEPMNQKARYISFGQKALRMPLVVSEAPHLMAITILETSTGWRCRPEISMTSLRAISVPSWIALLTPPSS